jgi:hypothetical protein
MSTFQVPAILEGVTPLKDGGVSLRFHTNEVTKDDKVMLMEFYQTFGWLLFSPNKMQTSDIPKAQATDMAGASPSKRLHSVLFVLWKQMGERGEFETFYKMKMEQFIDKVKENLV